MRILLLGATGLVGKNLLAMLAQLSAVHVTALVRKSGMLDSHGSGVCEKVFDFENEKSYEELSHSVFDVVFCCMGTTRAKAGSDSAFRKVDLDYPVRILKAVKKNNPLFCAISSVGAHAPRGLYLKTKHDLEKQIIESGLRYVILRPSLLLGKRSEFRAGEKTASFLFSRFAGIMAHKLGDTMAMYAPIEADKVARALVRNAMINPPKQGGRIVQGRELFIAD